MSFFLWLETGSFLETGKRLIVLVYECLRGMGVADTEEFGQREGVAATKEFRQKESVAATKKIRKRGWMCFKTTYL